MSDSFFPFLLKKPSLITIDGPGCSGKTSLGQALAKKLNFHLLDSGFLYRLFVYHWYQKAKPLPLKKKLVLELLTSFEKAVEFLPASDQFLYHQKALSPAFLYGKTVENFIPLLVNNKQLRYFITHYCQTLVAQKSFILLGRDAGSVIVPHADVKFYLDAKLATRIARKKKSYLAHPAVQLEENQPDWEKILSERDENDFTRALSPLKQNHDYIYVSNERPFKIVFQEMITIIKNELSSLLPKIAIIGTPNVGKSSLFNLLMKEKKVLVSQLSGTTRDPFYQDLEIKNFPFTLIDTGGLDFSQKTSLQTAIQLRTKRIIQQADLLLWLVDGTKSLTTNDQEISYWLKKKKAQTFLIVNKLDGKNFSPFQWKKLAVKKQIFFSNKTKFNFSLLLKELTSSLMKNILTNNPASQQAIHIAIIGKPNVGKSTFFNQIFQQPLALTSAKPHTTTNLTNKSFFYQNHQLFFYDTAGVRRKKLKSGMIEKKAKRQVFSFLTTIDLVLLMISLEKNDFTVQDKKMMDLIITNEKPFILIVNKKDLSNFNSLQIHRLIKQFFPYFKKNTAKIFIISSYQEFFFKKILFQKIIELHSQTKEIKKIQKKR